MNASIGAVILAAGRSSRMGGPKQWLPLGGRTVLARVLTTVRAAGLDDIVLVVGFAAERTGELDVNLLAAPGVKVVVNTLYNEGMASSLRVGIGSLLAGTAAAMIVLADQPLVRPETLHSIAEEYQRSRAKIVIPDHKGARGNPVLIDRNLFPEMMALSGETGARAIFARHQEEIVRLSVEDAGILLDMDTPEDFAELEEWDRADARERMKIEAAALRRRGR